MVKVDKTLVKVGKTPGNMLNPSPISKNCCKLAA